VPPVTISGIVWLDALLVAMGPWGYLATFLGGALENLFIVGGLMPGETVVMVVAAAASRDPQLWIAGVWFASILGTTAGSSLSYLIGRIGGRPLLMVVVARFPRLTKGLEDAEHYFEIHGTKTVFLARFTAGFKNFAPMLAGVSRMPLAPFESYTLLSAVVYSTGLCIIGYLFGANMEAALAWLSRAGVWAVVVIAVVVALYVAYRMWKKARIDSQILDLEVEEAEAALMDDDDDEWAGEAGDDEEI
jgi:membrane protein DedA with SNARE-associated domain